MPVDDLRFISEDEWICKKCSEDKAGGLEYLSRIIGPEGFSDDGLRLVFSQGPVRNDGA